MAERRIGRRGGVEPAQQRADVEPGAADDDRQTAAALDRANRERGVVVEARGLIPIVGVHDVDQMMGDSPPLLERRLAGGDVHAAVDLAGVRADDLDPHAPGQRHGDRRLADPGGPGDHDHSRPGAAHHHIHSISLDSKGFRPETQATNCA